MTGTKMANDGWMSPPEIMDRVYDLFGSYPSLDPFSNYKANKRIKATTFFSERRNALKKDWAVEDPMYVYANPPYSYPAIEDCVDKFIEEFFHWRGIHPANEKLGKRTKWVIVTNSSTSANWYQRLVANCDAVCLPKKRIGFIDPDTGKAKKNNDRPQSIFFFGWPVQEFQECFSDLGTIIVPFNC